MAHSIKGSWLWWLRLAVTLVLLGSYLAACLDVAAGAMLLLLLLAACVFPLAWPRQFGSWRGLVLLLLAILLPTLITAARWPDLPTSRPQVAAAVLLWALAAWAMLPATLALLLWRRLAGIPILLLGVALAPAASLLLLVISPPGAPVTATDMADMTTAMRLFAAITPLSFVSVACCLGPIFFLGSFVWLLYLEATRGEKRATALTPAPPARAEDVRRSGGTPGPGGS